ncbi:lytic transglycosylase domain-containing protein [Myxococcota bacterium]|nr:lytic transglycosylase domain-containing protein [Myxococcota bacterium]
MRVPGLALFALLLTPASAAASDLGEALRFSQEVVGDWVVEGYEEFVDTDPDEALSLLLSRSVIPNKSPDAYLEDDDGWTIRRTDHTLETLGDTRLNYGALKAFIQDAARETGLPAALIDAVIRTESGYRPAAVSRKGAIGLMQLLPGTAREVGIRDPYDPRENIIGGARYLRRMYDKFGSLRLAIAAYNAGPGNVQKHGGVPPFQETVRYVKTVLSRYQKSPHLND